MSVWNDLCFHQTTESTAKDTNTAHLQGQLAHSQTQLTARDQEISSLRRQLAGSSQELAQLKKDGARVKETISQLKEDLKTMTHESQALRIELQKVAEEKERLKVKVEEYVKNIAQYEETIAVKASIHCFYHSCCTHVLGSREASSSSVLSVTIGTSSTTRNQHAALS